MPETPNNHDDRFDRLLRDAGTRMRAATETAQPPAIRPTAARGAQRRWIVPVTIITATAAAVVAAVWIAGPATESVREIPADTGVDTSIHTVPDSAVDSVPVVAPVDSTPPSDTTPADSVAAVAGQPMVSITDADFDGAGGMCLRLVAETGTADACLTHRQLEDTPRWTVAFAEGAFELAVDPLDAVASSANAIGEVCGYAPSVLTQARWLNTSCSTDQYFWSVAAPELPGGESTTYVVAPRTGETIALVPIESALPNGFVAYRADYEEFGTTFKCLLVASFPDPWREACIYNSEVPPMLVPAGGSVFLVDPAPDVASVDVEDIAVLSVPIAGCTSPVIEMAVPLDSSVMIDGVVCAGDSAVISAPAVFLRHGPPDGLAYVLERLADGTWSTGGGGTTFLCPDDSIRSACDAFGVDHGDLRFAPLPIPPLEAFAARMHDLDPVEVTTEIREISGGARIPDEIAASVIARYDDRTPGDGQDPVIGFEDGLGLVTVDISLLDDSASLARYFVWYRPTESGELRVERAYRITACSRGAAAPDMCV